MAKKKWTPPKDDPGNIWSFVQTNYGRQTPARQRAIYNRLKQQNAEFGSDPTGQRSGMIRLTPEMANRLPEGWGGEGVQNVGRGLPQYDQTKFEIGQNANGRYFLRPITEFTGLGPSQVAAIREMDRRTQGQQSLIRANYSAAGDTAARDASNLSAQLAAIPGSGGTVAPASTGAATQAGVDDRSAETDRTARTLQAQRASMEAMAKAPALRQMGETEASAYGTSAQQARMQALSSFASGNAQAQAAADNLNARLRGQDLGLLGNQLRTGAQVNMNNADNARAIAQTNATVAQQDRESVRTTQTRLADINNRLRIARQNNNVQLSIALLRQQTALMKDKDPAKIAERTVRQVQGIVPNRLDADGNRIPIPIARQRKQFVQMMVAQGVPIARARALAGVYIKAR